MNLKNKLAKQRSKKASVHNQEHDHISAVRAKQEASSLTTRGGYVGKKWYPQGAAHKKGRA